MKMHLVENLPAATNHWFFRYKVYHLFFWAVYHYVWAVINSGSKPLEVLGFIYTSPKYMFYVVFQAIAVYFNLYYLIPKYLVKGRYVVYLVFLSLTTMAAASTIASGYYISAYVNGTTVLAAYQHENFSYFLITYSLPSTLTSTFLAMSIKLTKNWIQSRRREQLLEREKLETELKFLRSQLNPHFLFNTINSIFVLIHKNPDMASESLAKFSDLLRYQLYECNEAEIPLNNELEYLESYVELERLRLDSKAVRLTIDIQRSPSYDHAIAPFVLIPFIENAFKHVSTIRGVANWIEVKLSVNNDHLKFSVVNSVVENIKTSNEVIRNSGIGLQNVQRRLNLLYPHEHRLSIQRRDNKFEVLLDLTLRKQPGQAVFENRSIADVH